MLCKLDWNLRDVEEALKKRTRVGVDGERTTDVFKESPLLKDIITVHGALHRNIALESLNFRDGDRITFEVENGSEQPEVEDTEEQQEE